ncbi:hypothetical protein DSECCO2_196940 [anaerobic digester metagenome]
MVELSDHTKLMNIIIGLCHDIPHWPNPFTQKNYKISQIEAKIPESNPDIIISNTSTNHSILFECKSSHNVKEKQIEKYAKVRKDPSVVIQSGKVKVVHKRQYSVDIAYCSFEDLSSNELICKHDMHCIHIERITNAKINSIHLTRGIFSKNGLNAVFPIDTKTSKPPYFLYPFDENDIELFTKEMLNQLQKFALTNKNSFTTPELLSKTHPLWHRIDDKKKFEKKASSILSDLQKKGLKNYLERSKASGKWSITIKQGNRSFQAFQEKCMKLINKLDYKSYQDVLALSES